MDLGKISIDPRPRNTWQSIDLGFTLARVWWKPLFLSWLLPSVALWLLCSALSWGAQWWIVIVIWWLKPLFDRLPLFFASRALFGDRMSLPSLFKQLGSALKFEWFSWITIRRFSFNRSFNMPVTMLEQLSGKARARRLRVLHQATSGGSWLTLVCVHLEMFFSIGVMALVVLMVPAGVDLGLIDRYLEQSPLTVFASNGLTILAMSIIAPFYTMAGFTLYINRRIQLEGWDIEIHFRQLAQRFQRSAQPVSELGG